jgi:radical SAM protein with 4Fe4S-binding SPASM domain
MGTIKDLGFKAEKGNSQKKRKWFSLYQKKNFWANIQRVDEITQGLKYDIEKNRELWIIRKSELGSECGICEIRDTCADPCPDVLRFIDQDHVAPK